MTRWTTLLAIAGAALAATIFAPHAAEAQTYPYCVINNADVPIDVRHGGSNQQRVPPGNSTCCTARCQNPVFIGFWRPRERSNADDAQIIVSVLTKLARVRTVPGQPIMYDGFNTFCSVQWRHGEDIDVVRDGDEMRCDVVATNGQVRASIGPTNPTGQPAEAGIEICNQAQDGPAFGAVAYDNGGGWTTEGWYEIAEGQCGPLPLPDGYRGYAYAFVQTDTYDYYDDWLFCVDPQEPFTITDADRETCGWRYEQFGFTEFYIDGVAERFTLEPAF